MGFNYDFLFNYSYDIIVENYLKNDEKIVLNKDYDNIILFINDLSINNYRYYEDLITTNNKKMLIIINYPILDYTKLEYLYKNIIINNLKKELLCKIKLTNNIEYFKTYNAITKSDITYFKNSNTNTFINKSVIEKINNFILLLDSSNTFNLTKTPIINNNTQPKFTISNNKNILLIDNYNPYIPNNSIILNIIKNM